MKKSTHEIREEQATDREGGKNASAFVQSVIVRSMDSKLSNEPFAIFDTGSFNSVNERALTTNLTLFDSSLVFRRLKLLNR